MEEKKTYQNDSKKKVPATSKSNPMKPQSVKPKMPRVPKPPIPHTEEDFPFGTDDDTYYRDDNAGD